MLLLPLLLFSLIDICAQCPVGFYQSFDNSKCFYIERSLKTFIDSSINCVQISIDNGFQTSNLISIHSAFENNNALTTATTVANCTDYWIGLNDIGNANNWIWSDTSPVNYQNWDNGNPQSSADSECVVMTSAGRWQNRHCSTPRHCSICQVRIDDQLPPTASPSPTPSGYNPCYSNILIAIDATSSNTTLDNYTKQKQFISQALVNQWNHFDRLALMQYSGTFVGSTYGQISDYQQFLQLVNDNRYGQLQSNQNRLHQTLLWSAAPTLFGSSNIWQQTIIFTTPIDIFDIYASSAIADYLRFRGSLIFVLMGNMTNSQNSQDFNRLGKYFQWVDYDQPPIYLSDNIVASFSCTPTPTPTSSPIDVPSGFNPCYSNIAILIDNTNRLSSIDFNRQLHFVSESLITDQWNHFERIGIYDGQYFTDYGLLTSYTNARNRINGMFYSGDNRTTPIADLLVSSLFLSSYTSLNDTTTQTILFTASSDPIDVEKSMALADYWRSKGRLMIVGIGDSIDLPALRQLTPFVYRWMDINHVPATLSAQIAASFACP